MLSSFLFHPGFQPEKGYYVATRRETGGKFVFQRSGASYFRIFSKNLAKKALQIFTAYLTTRFKDPLQAISRAYFTVW